MPEHHASWSVLGEGPLQWLTTAHRPLRRSQENGEGELYWPVTLRDRVVIVVSASFALYAYALRAARPAT